MRALMWFRSDLRLANNPALAHACRSASRGIVAVFCATPQQWQAHDWGLPRLDWLGRNLLSLQSSLQSLHIPLHFLQVDDFASCSQSLERLADSFSCDALFFNREYELNEQRRDAQITQQFRQRGRQIFAYDDQVMVPPGSLRTQAGGFFSVYTPFKKAWLQHLLEAPPPAPLPVPQAQKTSQEFGDGVSAVAELPAALAGPSALTDAWPAGEQAAQHRLQHFVASKAKDYNVQRDLPAVDGTSGLSPYLAVGALSPAQCFAALHDAYEGELLRDASAKHPTGRRGLIVWLQELIWREFYRHVVVGYPRVCMHRAFQERTDALAWRVDDDHFEAWQNGRTGVPIVDAAMRQLRQTGWMHNRLRMIVAMYLSKDLFLDWRQGERYFMQHLLDGDLASNNGGWQWSASTGTDAAPYFRIFNPILQSRKCDPHGAFIRHYLPELHSLDDMLVHDPSPLGSTKLQQLGYFSPLVDHAQSKQRVLAAFAFLAKRSS